MRRLEVQTLAARKLGQVRYRDENKVLGGPFEHKDRRAVKLKIMRAYEQGAGIYFSY